MSFENTPDARLIAFYQGIRDQIAAESAIGECIVILDQFGNGMRLVIRVDMTVHRPLPVSAEKRTFLASIGTSVSCQHRTKADSDHIEA
jgi:hypothetical protein